MFKRLLFAGSTLWETPEEEERVSLFYFLFNYINTHRFVVRTRSLRSLRAHASRACLYN